MSLINGATADERFTINPSPTAGRVLFDRLATPGPGAFSVDIGTTETLQLEANAGNDRIKGAKGVAGRISTVLNAGDGNDVVKGTDAEDAISLGKGSDIARTIDKAEDTVSCDQGIDLALVDRRDFLRQCELVIGGVPRVKIKGKPQLDGDSAAVRLKCVATQKCKSAVKLKAGGKTLGRGKATLKRGKTQTVDVELNRRGRRVLSAGDRVKVQVVSKDNRGQRLAVDEDRPGRVAPSPSIRRARRTTGPPDGQSCSTAVACGRPATPSSPACASPACTAPAPRSSRSS